MELEMERAKSELELKKTDTTQVESLQKQIERLEKEKMSYLQKEQEFKREIGECLDLCIFTYENVYSYLYVQTMLLEIL